MPINLSEGLKYVCKGMNQVSEAFVWLLMLQGMKFNFLRGE